MMEGENMTLRDALSSVIGDYSPNTVTREEMGVDGSVVTLSDTTPDWTWFGSLAVLLVFLFCFFRAIGGLLKCKV